MLKEKESNNRKGLENIIGIKAVVNLSLLKDGEKGP